MNTTHKFAYVILSYDNTEYRLNLNELTIFQFNKLYEQHHDLTVVEYIYC